MKRVIFDIAALVARVTVGVIFVAHGWQKWTQGLGATSRAFAQMGVPQAQLAAAFSTVAELVGGVLLILGLLVRPAALILLVSVAGAIVFVHGRNGLFVQNGGWELVAALGATALLLLALGGGRLGLDGVVSALFGRRRAEREPVPEPGDEAGPGVTRPAPDSKATYPHVSHEPHASALNEEDMRDVEHLLSDRPATPKPRTR